MYQKQHGVNNVSNYGAGRISSSSGCISSGTVSLTQFLQRFPVQRWGQRVAQTPPPATLPEKKGNKYSNRICLYILFYIVYRL